MKKEIYCIINHGYVHTNYIKSVTGEMENTIEWSDTISDALKFYSYEMAKDFKNALKEKLDTSYGPLYLVVRKITIEDMKEIDYEKDK